MKLVEEGYAEKVENDMEDNRLSVSVIICAYTCDRWSALEHALDSIRNQTVQPTEVILVVDHNPMLFEQAKMTFQGVKVIENQQSRGLSGARNSGISQSVGDVIAFMDEDAVADPHWVENLLHGYQDPRVIGVGGEVLPNWNSNAPEWFPPEFYWVVGCSYKGLPLTPAPVRNPIGCNMSFKREALISAGGFRLGMGRVGTLPIGCEETELSIRISQANPNSTILYHPAAIVSHYVPGWRIRLDYYARRCFSEGLSKALVAHYVGANDGLSSERPYIINTLANGVITGVSQTIFQHKLAGLKRAGLIIVGLSLTVAGYLVGNSKFLWSKFQRAWTGEAFSLQDKYLDENGLLKQS